MPLRKNKKRPPLVIYYPTGVGKAYYSGMKRTDFNIKLFSMDKTIITKEQAMSLLNDGETIHTFANPNGLLLGSDISRERLNTIFTEASQIEIAGDGARSLKHGIAVFYDDKLLFVETNEEKLNKFDPITLKS